MLPSNLELSDFDHPDFADYSEGLKAHEFRVQKCKDCGHVQWPPRCACVECLSYSLGWTPLSGRGEIFSFTISRMTSVAAYRSQLPYVIAIIETSEGIRVLGHVDTEDPESLAIGSGVEIHFAEIESGTLPFWRVSSETVKGKKSA
jgi:uncharacterized OB-fold protein